jgi:hypothetical protein
MTHLIATDITGVEALKLVRKGQQLKCPRCASIIKTIPENWRTGMPLYGIECPKEQRHFMIHCEDANAMKEMRARMKARATQQPQVLDRRVG